jgi:hypothetical protein
VSHQERSFANVLSYLRPAYVTSEQQAWNAPCAVLLVNYRQILIGHNANGLPPPTGQGQLGLVIREDKRNTTASTARAVVQNLSVLPAWERKSE